MRYGVLGYIEKSSYNLDILLRNIVADFFVVYVYYNSENQEKSIFKNFYNYREELKKYKLLLDNYLPQSLIILDTENQGSLFVNKAFSKHFDSYSRVEDILHKESTPVTLLINDALDFSIPHISSLKFLGSSKDANPTIKFKNLRELIKILLANKFFESSAVLLTASFHHSDHPKTFEVVVMPITWDIQDAVAVVIHDITDQEEAFVSKVADQNKDLVAATMSHELRTPLNGIIGIIQMIEPKLEEDQETATLLSLCKDNALLLQSLVNSILDLQQVYYGRLKLQISKFQIEDAITNIVQLFRFQLDRKGLSFAVKVAAGMQKSVENDLSRLNHILLHLIGNAVKFTFQGGISVDVTDDPDDHKFLRISIVDTGVGIKPEQVTALFKMFRKVEDQKNFRTHGLGIGLTISDTLARALNGEESTRGIGVESEYGKGSRFWFRLLKHRAQVAEEIQASKESQEDKLNEEEMELASHKYSFKSMSFDEGDEAMDDEDIEECPNISMNLTNHCFKNHSSSMLPNVSQINPLTLNGLSSLQIEDKSESISSKNQPSRELSKSARSQRIDTKGSTDEKKFLGYALIVDDNSFNLMIAKNFAEILGYKVVTAVNGEKALQEAKKCSKAGNVIKVILMDCQMPVMDGFEATIKLREMMSRNEINTAPIIAITANDTDEDRAKCLKVGMSDHIAKPILLEKLKKSILKFCNN